MTIPAPLGPLKAVVFDFDGVIVDSEPLHYRAFLRAAQSVEVSFTWEEYLDQYIGYDDRDAFRVMLGHPAGVAGSATVEQQVRDLGHAKAQAFEDEVNAGVDAIPGVLALIADLRGKLPIAIASGATRHDIDLILRKLKLEGVFNPIVTADLVERSKPDPASYALAVQQLAALHPQMQLTPGKCLSIEDTAAGVQSARGAGLMSLGLATSGNSQVLHQAHRVVNDLAGVNLAQLRQWFG